MCNLNCYYAEGRRFDSFFVWLRVTQQCACNGSQRVAGCNPVSTCSPTVTCNTKTEPKVTVTWSPKTEPKVVKKFKRKSPIPIQICLRKNDNIQIHQYTEMSQYSNPNPSAFSALVNFMYWACETQGSRPIFLVLRWKSSSSKCAKLHTVAASNSRDHPRDHSILACAHHIYLCVALCAHPICRESHFKCNTNRQVATTSPPFCNEPHLSHVLFVKVCTWHHLHILVKAPLCCCFSCDWKARAASAQSSTSWLQATIEIPRRAHSIYGPGEDYYHASKNLLDQQLLPTEVRHCQNFNCTDEKHLEEIENLYAELTSALLAAASSAIKITGKKNESKFSIPGWNSVVKSKHQMAKAAFRLWVNCNIPKTGGIYWNMTKTKKDFKYSLRQCRKDVGQWFIVSYDSANKQKHHKSHRMQ